jgi:hypothetical protein
VKFKLSSQSFGGNDFLTLWMNGAKFYQGAFMKEKNLIVQAPLQKGWNALVFKDNHQAWQWQVGIDLVDAPGQDALRVTAVPPAL